MAVLAYIENWDGKFKKATAELLSYTRETAKLLGVEAKAVSIGRVEESALAELGKYGVSDISHIDLDPQFNGQLYTENLAHAAESLGADVIVLGNSYNGKSMGPRLAARTAAGLVTGAIALPDTSNGFKVRKGVFSGKGFAEVELNAAKKIITLNINSFGVSEQAVDVQISQLDAKSKDTSLEVKEVKLASGKIPLTEAELVVSAGRGLKGPENWGMIEELADLLGAGTACSKPVSDVGWRPHAEHVGQTGITIGPNLYIAVGISGAIQHLAGVSSSKVICVVNKDPEAPFFKAADYGIVGDAFDVVPKLIEAVKQLKQSA